LVEEFGVSGFKLLVHLYRSGESSLSNIPMQLNIDHTSLYHAIYMLSQQGLVEIVDSWTGRSLKLTEKGVRVAKLLAEADDILRSWKNPCQ